jgi:hypothetical protein
MIRNNDILMKEIQGFVSRRREMEWEIRAIRIIRDTNINDRTRVVFSAVHARR